MSQAYSHRNISKWNKLLACQAQKKIDWSKTLRYTFNWKREKEKDKQRTQLALLAEYKRVWCVAVWLCEYKLEYACVRVAMPIHMHVSQRRWFIFLKVKPYNSTPPPPPESPLCVFASGRSYNLSKIDEKDSLPIYILLVERLNVTPSRDTIQHYQA